MRDLFNYDRKHNGLRTIAANVKQHIDDVRIVVNSICGSTDMRSAKTIYGRAIKNWFSCIQRIRYEAVEVRDLP